MRWLPVFRKHMGAKDRAPRLRVSLFASFFLFGFLVLFARLFYWQVVKGKVLAAEARSQYVGGGLLQAPRGSILASDGSFLAVNTLGWALIANPQLVHGDPRTLAEQIATRITQREPEEEEASFYDRMLAEIDRITQLLSRDAVWSPLADKITEDQKRQLGQLDTQALSFEPQEIRTYPEASSAAHLLGFVGKDSAGADLGYFGLEGYYDQTLAGKPGFLSRESDALGAPILVGDEKEISALDGIDVVTHIDKRVQLLVEQKLAKGIETYGAASGTIIVMEPSTGAIVAMASQPTYDPREYAEYGDAYFKNPAVSDSFEPGSIFKVLVMAAGLDAGVVEPDTTCDICGGPYKVDKYFINTWDGSYRPDSTMTDVIVHSDNVGMVFVANRLGRDKLYDYLVKFGIGALTGVDLQGESTAKLRERDDWSIVDVAVGSFGQGVATTPLQMLTAVASLANGGLKVIPHVADKLVGDGWEQDLDFSSGQRILSAEAAAKITGMMVAAAKDGEAKWTYTRGFEVAGKTGTAQIPIAGHYDAEKTIASFVGFAPATHPKFVMMVTLREPTSSPWSSETAAPLWYQIAHELFLYYNIQPN